MDPLKILDRLERQLQGRERNRLVRNDAYYTGNPPLRYMAPALEAEVGDRIAQLIIDYPALVVDAYENRLDIEGFRYPKADSGDEALWDMWQARDGDETAQQVHLESLIHGRSFVIVGSAENEGDPPVMTGEHPLQVATIRDPKTREVTAALKRWQDEDGAQWASLYLPDSTTTYARSTRGGRAWTQKTTDPHELGEVPVVPFVNLGRMLDPLGVAEFQRIIRLADAANKIATDMMVSAEFHAMPRRWVIGMTEEDFTPDDTSGAMSTWSLVASRIWGTNKSPDDVKFGQFEESDLAVFHNTIKLLGQLVGQIAYLPQDYVAFTTAERPNADAQRASESRFVKRIERKHTTLSGSWERVQRLMLRLDGADADTLQRAKSLETLWRDPSTPTRAQMADAVVKLTQGDRPVIPIEQAREDLQYTDGQRRRMKEMDREAADRDLLGTLAESFRQPAPVEPVPALAGQNGG